MEPLNSLAALREEIARLPPIPPGKVRVFRGQSSDYQTIRAAAVRSRLPNQVIWDVYSHDLLADITGTPFTGEMDAAAFQVFALWLHAVAQHYGAGSEFLDVTRSPESAAWFALHCTARVSEQAWLGASGPPSLFDLPGETEWVAYSPATAPGFFYAFDVDVWDGNAPPVPDLSLVDLNLAPEPFRTPRMLAQQGCLIHVGQVDGYNLKKHCVPGTPLPIAWPMTGSDMVNKPVEEMFPRPSLDPWYRRFLGVPLNPEMDPKTGTVVLKRPLSATLYQGATAAYNDEIRATEAFLFPPLLHRALLQSPLGADHSSAGEWWETFPIAAASPIVLEAPYGRTLPPAGRLWNHELLVSDIADSAPSYTAHEGSLHADGEAKPGLKNVLIQFSHLENNFWERAASGGLKTTLTRGVWIVRRGSDLMAVLLQQDFPGTAVRAWAPALIRLDPAKRRLVMKPAHSDMDWAELSGLPELAKPVFVALHLLRAISPLVKPEATPRVILRSAPKDGPVENQFLVAMIPGTALLVRCPDPAGLADWYMMRGPDGDPYTPSLTGIGIIKIVSGEEFADLRVEAFRDAWLSELAAQKP